MIYLASAYSHSDPAVREARFQEICKIAAALIKSGHVVFSPIAHSHHIAILGKLMPTDWQLWKAQDEEHIRRCDELWVVTMDGWRESVGVQEEIRMAREMGKPVFTLDPASMADGGFTIQGYSE